MSVRIRVITFLLLSALWAFLPTATADERAILAAVDTAYVAQDPDGREWTIGNAGIRFSVGLNSAGLLVVRALDRPGFDPSWAVGESPDLSFTIQTRRTSPGQPGLPYRQVTADAYRGGVRLRITFDDLTARLRVTRAYLCYPTAPVIETWTTFEVLEGATSVSIGDIGVWQMSIGANAINWVNGLKAAAIDGGRFTRRRQVLTSQPLLQLGSTARSSEQMVPTVWFEGPSGHFMRRGETSPFVSKFLK